MGYMSATKTLINAIARFVNNFSPIHYVELGTDHPSSPRSTSLSKISDQFETWTQIKLYISNSRFYIFQLSLATARHTGSTNSLQIYKLLNIRSSTKYHSSVALLCMNVLLMLEIMKINYLKLVTRFLLSLFWIILA